MAFLWLQTIQYTNGSQHGDHCLAPSIPSHGEMIPLTHIPRLLTEYAVDVAVENVGGVIDLSTEQQATFKVTMLRLNGSKMS